VRIDIHTHLITPGAVPSAAELARAARLAQHFHIRRVVLLGNITATGGRNPSPEDIVAINDHTLAAMAARPELYIGFCYLNPAHSPAFIQEEIDRCIVAGGMKGIKLWISVKATDPRLDLIMERARELNVPVLHHSWYQVTPVDHNGSTPDEIAHLARRHPGTTVIMAHLGGVRERGIRDIEELPNVYVDTSGSQPEAGMVEYAVRRIGAGRIIFGSDWPLRDFGVQLGRIVGADLTAEENRKIFYDNAAKVLKLEE